MEILDNADNPEILEVHGFFKKFAQTFPDRFSYPHFFDELLVDDRTVRQIGGKFPRKIASL